MKCPSCDHELPEASVRCEHCGVQLEGEKPDQAMFGKDSTKELEIPEDVDSTKEPRITLQLVDSGDILTIPESAEFNIGRSISGSEKPDIDLSSYAAYEHGVSRSHAKIKTYEQQFVIVDLGSSNGTRVNGQKIIPDVECLITHGDVISLGKLRIQVAIH